jgi:hypothetical protein
MGDNLSIIATDEDIEIKGNKSDVAATFAKGILGAVVPHIGGMLAEVVSTVIPNQKLDRLITFAKVLDDKVKYIEEDMLEVKMKSEEFTDLLEDGLIQASRALSDERRHHIASLLKNSLSKDELAHIEKKKLLSLLNELNDIEIVRLKYHSLRPLDEDEFWERNKALLSEPSMFDGSPQEEIDKHALYKSYGLKLEQLGLLEGERTSDLGDLLLRYLDLKEDR